MKKIILLLLLCNFSSFVQGQNSVIDSLAKELKKVKNDEDKAKLYVKLAVASIRANDDTKFAKYTLQLDSLVKKINNPRIIGASYKLSSILERDRKNYQGSIDLSEKAVNQFVIAKDSIQISKSVNSAIRSFIKLEKLDEAELFFLKYRSWITLYWSYKISMDLSKYYIAIDDYNKTSHYLEYCYMVANKINDKQLIGKVYYRMAQLNMDLKNYDEASKNIYKAIEYLNPKKNNQLYGAAYFTLGSILDYQKLGKESLSALDSAYFYYQGKKSIRSRAKVLSHKANVYLNLKQNDQARKAIEKAINLHLELNDERALSFAYLRLGNILFHAKNKNDSAVYYMEKSLSIAKKYNIKTQIKSAHYNLSNFLFEDGKYKNAYINLKEAYKYSDSLYKIDLSKKMKEVEEKYQNEKKEKELALERATNKELALQNAELNNLIYIIGSTIIIVGILLFFYLRSKKQQIENERQKTSLEVNRLEKEVNDFENEWALRNSKDEAFIISIQENFYKHLKEYFNIPGLLVRFWNLQATSGLTEKEISETMEIPFGTIDGQRQRLYKKLSLKMNKKYNRNSSVALYLKEYKKFVKKEFLRYQAY